MKFRLKDPDSVAHAAMNLLRGRQAVEPREVAAYATGFLNRLVTETEARAALQGLVATGYLETVE